jgi:hypothetical protein
MVVLVSNVIGLVMFSAELLVEIWDAATVTPLDRVETTPPLKLKTSVK